ncbi:hypothetical protein KUCAC02_031769, partial [Chaenocephalus aceratus]
MDPQNNMENEAKMFLSHAKTLRLHTGNIVNRSRLKKKCPCSPSEELQDCIQAALSDWKAATKPPSNDFPDTLDCSIPQPTDAIPPEEREELRVSVKLFLCEAGESSIRDAVEMACQTLAVSQLDSVIIAPTWPLAEGRTRAWPTCSRPGRSWSLWSGARGSLPSAPRTWTKTCWSSSTPGL